jgi:hypothetical protein
VGKLDNYEDQDVSGWIILCEMPERRNSGIGSEVDFVGNELLRQLHDNRQPIPR